MTAPARPPEVLVIAGATATGKSDLALRLALALDGEIIGADSVQIYRGLDAGSCKPSAAARAQVPHHLIDILDPVSSYSAGRFAREASALIQSITAAGRTPIVAGGTGLYLRALLHGIAPLPPRDDGVRGRLYEEAARRSREALHADLARLDPVTAARLMPRDLQRVVRALEVLELTGEPLSAHIARQRAGAAAPRALVIGMALERALLYGRINARVDRIFEAGIVPEVQGLLAGGLDPGAASLKALAYREVVAHLRGDYDGARCIELVKRNTRHYARRQLIWFGREPDIVWIDAGTGSPQDLDRLARQAGALWGAARG